MPPKYYGRAPSHISRDTGSVETGGREPSWFGEFVTNLEKAGVKSKKDDFSFFDQINGILGNKSKYSNVEEAVLDMQRRTGLSELLQHKKQAQLETENKHGDIELFKKVPLMKTFIDNYTDDDHPGTSVEAVIHDMMKNKTIKDHITEEEITDDVKSYISDKIGDTLAARPSSGEEDMNIGKTDLTMDDNVSADNDPFGGCMPAKDSK